MNTDLDSFMPLPSSRRGVQRLRNKPTGAVRITCDDHIIRTTLLPKRVPLLNEFTDIKIAFDIHCGFRKIVADRFDAGVRMGDTLDKDMIAVPVGLRTRPLC